MDNLRICPATAGTLKVARSRRQGTEPVDPWPDTFTSSESVKGRGKNGKNKEEGPVESGASATISGTESIPICSCETLPQSPDFPLRTHLCKWSPPPAWESFLDWDALNDLFSEVSAHSLKPNTPTLGSADVHGLPSDASSTTIIDLFFAHPNTGPCIDPSLTMSHAMSEQMGISLMGTQQDSGVSQSFVASSILGKRGRLEEGEAGLGTMHINGCDDCFWDNEDSTEEMEAASELLHLVQDDQRVGNKKNIVCASRALPVFIPIRWVSDWWPRPGSLGRIPSIAAGRTSNGHSHGWISGWKVPVEIRTQGQNNDKTTNQSYVLSSQLCPAAGSAARLARVDIAGGHGWRKTRTSATRVKTWRKVVDSSTRALTWLESSFTVRSPSAPFHISSLAMFPQIIYNQRPINSGRKRMHGTSAVSMPSWGFTPKKMIMGRCMGYTLIPMSSTRFKTSIWLECPWNNYKFGCRKFGRTKTSPQDLSSCGAEALNFPASKSKTPAYRRSNIHHAASICTATSLTENYIPPLNAVVDNSSHPYHVGHAQLPTPASPPAYSNPPPPPPPYHAAITQPAYIPQGAALSLSTPAIGAVPTPSLPTQTLATGIPAAVTAIGAAASANLNGPVGTSPANATPTPVPTPAFAAQTGATIPVNPPAFTAAAPTNVNGPIGASTSATATSSLTEAAPASGGS
ncbi:hypothetical protein B0H11DRAFT_1916325 [Mycena galericulata]|nr:hypothetical protein B0H11DRAFT_1916325 [Mycena galericulata]